RFDFRDLQPLARAAHPFPPLPHVQLCPRGGRGQAALQHAMWSRSCARGTMQKLTNASATIAAPANVADDPPHWRLTMWAMVGVQVVMSTSFSFLSPIMPLFLPELGVHSASAVDLWAGILSSVTSFVSVFTQPMWGRMADTYGRKLMVLRSSLMISAF